MTGRSIWEAVQGGFRALFGALGAIFVYAGIALLIIVRVLSVAILFLVALATFGNLLDAD